jgi:hypothetical protein
MRPFEAQRKDELGQVDTSSPKKLVPNARPETTELPPELAAVVEVWPDLPEAIRADILAMIRAALT